MKLIACADLHIKSNRPQYRKDDYFQTAINKFKQIINIANKHDAILIVAGDFFDSVTVGHKVVNNILEALEKLKNKCYVCAGQHDLSYHTHDLSSSPLQTLIYTKKIILLNQNNPLKIFKDEEEEWLYGCSFEQEPVKPKYENSILVIHKSITPEKPPFFLPDALSAEDAIDKYTGYYLIISGDFHEPFSLHKYGNVLINCGPMLRQNIDQTELKPRVWLVDTIKQRHKQIFLDIEPAELVFSLEEIGQKKESNFSKELEELVKILKSKSNNPDYKKTVRLVMDKEKVPKNVRDKVNFILGEVLNE